VEAQLDALPVEVVIKVEQMRFDPDLARGKGKDEAGLGAGFEILKDLISRLS